MGSLENGRWRGLRRIESPASAVDTRKDAVVTHKPTCASTASMRSRSAPVRRVVINPRSRFAPDIASSRFSSTVNG